MKKAWIKILCFLYNARIRRYCQWLNYEIGLTGHGPTAFDMPPDKPKLWIPAILRMELDRIANLDRIVRQVFAALRV